jgi:hypothetical protein
MIASMEGRADEANALFEQALATDSNIQPEIAAAYREHRIRTRSSPQATPAAGIPEK